MTVHKYVFTILNFVSTIIPVLMVHLLYTAIQYFLHWYQGDASGLSAGEHPHLVLGSGGTHTHTDTVDAAVEGRAGAGAPGTDMSGGGKKQLATLQITMPPTHLHSKVKTG